MYGKYELLDELMAYKVRPAPAKPAGKWETGTQSFESLAGVTAAVDYLAGISGDLGSRRERLIQAMQRIKRYEMSLSQRFLVGATQVPGLRVYGITDVERLAERTPTFAVSLEGVSAETVATRLGGTGYLCLAWSLLCRGRHGEIGFAGKRRADANWLCSLQHSR